VRWIIDQIYEHVVAAGFDDLGRAHVGLFRYPTAEGLRPSELAERLQVSKQSVNDLLRDLGASCRSGHWALRAERTFGRVTVRREGLA
jgi:hypothetical protein